MDWLEYVLELVKLEGAMGAISVLLASSILIMFLMFSKRMEGLTKAIIILTDKVSSPYLNSILSVRLFRNVMSNHISKKLSYLGNILDINNILEREEQIKKNIGREFKNITTEEAHILSEYKSVCGDMGKILEDNIDWEKFLTSVYLIFFSQDKDRQKMIDIKTLMNEKVNEIAKIIEDNGIHN